MIRLTRIVGFLLIVLGALVILGWLIDPVREVLDQLWPWILQLPWPIRWGLGTAAVGLVLLMASLLWERFENRAADRELIDEP